MSTDAAICSVSLTDDFSSDTASSEIYHLLKFNFKPDAIADGEGTLSAAVPDDEGNGVVHVEYPSTTPGSAPHRYIGQQQIAKATDCILIWDPSQDEYRLHRLSNVVKLTKHKGSLPPLPPPPAPSPPPSLEPSRSRADKRSSAIEASSPNLGPPTKRLKLKPLPSDTSVASAIDHLRNRPMNSKDNTPLASPDETIELDLGLSSDSEPISPIAALPPSKPSPATRRPASSLAAILNSPRPASTAAALTSSPSSPRTTHRPSKRASSVHSSSSNSSEDSDSDDEEFGDLANELDQNMSRHGSAAPNSAPNTPKDGFPSKSQPSRPVAQVSRKSLPATVTSRSNPMTLTSMLGEGDSVSDEDVDDSSSDEDD